MLFHSTLLCSFAFCTLGLLSHVVLILHSHDALLCLVPISFHTSKMAAYCHSSAIQDTTTPSGQHQLQILIDHKIMMARKLFRKVGQFRIDSNGCEEVHRSKARGGSSVKALGGTPINQNLLQVTHY